MGRQKKVDQLYESRARRSGTSQQANGANRDRDNSRSPAELVVKQPTGTSKLSVDPLELPSVLLSQHRKLPPCAAVYFAISETNEVLYIG